jgi:hypothetical protein
MSCESSLKFLFSNVLNKFKSDFFFFFLPTSGPLTKAYGQIIIFLQFRPVIGENRDTVSFLTMFWLLLLVTAIIAGIAGFVMHSFHQRSFRHVWHIQVLNFIIAVLVEFLAVSSLSILMAPWFCDPHRSLAVCFSAGNVVILVTGLIATALLIGLLFSATLTRVFTRHEPNDLLASSVPNFNLYSNMALVLFTMLGEYFGKPFLLGSIWSMIVYLVILVMLEYVLLRDLPFHHGSTVRWHSGALMILIWMSLCGLLSSMAPENEHNENRVLDYLMVLGYLPSYMVGSWVARHRIMTARGWCQLVMTYISNTAKKVEEGTENAGFNAPGAPSPATARRSTMVFGSQPAQRNHVDLGEKITKVPYLLELLRNSHNVEIVGRYLLQTRQWEVVEAWYRGAMSVNVNNVRISHMYCNFVDIAREQSPHGSAIAEATTYEAVAALDPNFDIRFLLFCRQMDSEQKSATANVISGMDKLDLLQYVEFQRSYTEAKRYHAKCVASVQQFWILFLSSNVKFSSFESAVRMIITNTRRADTFYRSLLSRVCAFFCLLSYQSKWDDKNMLKINF